MQTITSPLQATLVEWLVAAGDKVTKNQIVSIVEAMKMEHEIRAGCDGQVTECLVKVGDLVQQGETLATLQIETSAPASPPRCASAPRSGGTNALITLAAPVPPARGDVSKADRGEDAPQANVRPDLAKVLQRQATTTDSARPAAVSKRHTLGFQTARENIAQLCDEGTFLEYGAFALAAQSQRRSEADLIANTPADGMVTGIGKVSGQSVAILAYDATVLAGTQGMRNHQKTDRLIGIAREQKLPVVLFAEGGGGRPGDTDMPIVAGLHITTFANFARLRGQVPVIGIAQGRCFAGNAALLGCCDFIIATKDSNIGMGGPAMIEGGGLGVFKPEEIGAADVQHQNGVIDVLVGHETEGIEVTKRLLQLVSTTANNWGLTPKENQALQASNQSAKGSDPNWLAASLRNSIPENRLRVYDTLPIIELLADESSTIHLKTGYGLGIHTALATIEGRAVGIMANNPLHLGGAIDPDAADKAVRFMRLCNRFKLPIVSLIDTPGFMVGPEIEAQGQVKFASEMFIASAELTVSFFSIVLRKGYGLGAMAMAAGGFHVPTFTIAWPTAEFGAMGLEGAVRLGFRKELEACADEIEREGLFQKLLAEHIERGSAINMAATLEIDAVIDPAQTRVWLISALK
jgi:acetyl-CoA carboxylase carboxyltransferase component